MSTDAPGLAGPPDEGAGQSGVPPTCYRHQGRETWVRCTRCERPICPDCMREAAVGFHCPECVRDGSRTARQARTVFGGRQTLSAGRVTWTIVAINVVMYVLQLISENTSRLPNITFDLGMLPFGVAHGQWWRLITAAFLHSPGSFFHILFNMWALIVLGPSLEAAFGRLRFVALYLLSALGGSILSYLIAPPGLLSIGASGAIFGLFGAAFVVSRRLNFDSRWIVGLLVINLGITFVVPGIAWQAHIGGLVTGLVVAFGYAYAPRASRVLVQLSASLGVFAVLVVLYVLRTLTFAG